MTFSRILASLITACAIFGIVIFAAPYFMENGRQDSFYSASRPSQSFIPAKNEQKEATFQAESSTGGIHIPGTSTVFLPAGKTSADVPFYNPEKNKEYLLQFELVLVADSSRETLVKTEKLNPGEKAGNVELSRALEAGTYDGILVAQPYYLQNPSIPTNLAEMNLKIIVQ